MTSPQQPTAPELPDNVVLTGICPRVSVVLAVFNGVDYIAEAINSILTQTFQDFELLVIDDGSTDGTRALLAPLAAHDRRLIVQAEPHRGLVGSLNHGIGIARGSLIARMDADDVALPGRFAAQVAYLDAHPDCVVVGTSILKVNADGQTAAKKSLSRWRLPTFDPMAFPPQIGGVAHPTAMIRASALAKVGGYRPHFYNAEDRDLWARLWTIGRVHQLPDVALRYRVHAGSVTRQKRGAQLLSHMLVDMSAVARHLNLNDDAILQRALDSGNKQAALDDYADLIGDAYPVDTYRMYHCIRNRMWSFAPFQSRRDMLMRVGRHAITRPFDANRLKLLGTLLRHGPASQRLGKT
jgi:glycosyltransferase involved in cell wall biosynthesis